MNNLNQRIIEVESDDDVRLSLQISTPTIIGADGEREGKPEVALLMEDLDSAIEPIPWMATTFTYPQLCGLIDALEEMRQRLRAML